MSRRRRRILGAAGALIPSGASLWLDASDVSTITDSSGSVSAWADKSGNGNNATQGTGSSQPTTGVSTINGRNGLVFADGDVVTSSAVFSTSGYTAFMVMQLSVAVADLDNDFPRFFRSGDDAQSHFLRKSNGRMEVKSIGVGGTDDRPNYTWESNFATNETVVIQHDVGLDNIRLYGNGTLLDGDNRTTPMTSLTVGSNIEVMTDMQGVCGEFIVYDRILSTSEAAQVESYLTSKWIA